MEALGKYCMGSWFGQQVGHLFGLHVWLMFVPDLKRRRRLLLLLLLLYNSFSNRIIVSVHFSTCYSILPGNYIPFCSLDPGPPGRSRKLVMVVPKNDTFFSARRCVHPFEGQEQPGEGTELLLHAESCLGVSASKLRVAGGLFCWRPIISDVTEDCSTGRKALAFEAEKGVKVTEAVEEIWGVCGEDRGS